MKNDLKTMPISAKRIDIKKVSFKYFALDF